LKIRYGAANLYAKLTTIGGELITTRRRLTTFVALGDSFRVQ